MGLAAALVPSLIALAPGAPVAPVFDPTQLGMSLAAWRSEPLAPGIDPSARPACATDPALAAADPNPLSPRGEDRTSALVCGYVSVYGRLALGAQVPLIGRFKASRLRFLFQDGRLAEIDCDASVDAFNDVTAFLDSLDGPPADAARDVLHSKIGSLAQVRMSWRRDGATIQLIDPEGPNYDHLTIRLAASSGSGANSR
ncbi:MAG TPA: hypothetical protein VME40_09825 [Caulobacteraceae bacterium]|nr:hypothetical protein [Caulobacteraceae bacterium]